MTLRFESIIKSSNDHDHVLRTNVCFITYDHGTESRFSFGVKITLNFLQNHTDKVRSRIMLWKVFLHQKTDLKSVRVKYESRLRVKSENFLSFRSGTQVKFETFPDLKISFSIDLRVSKRLELRFAIALN